MLGDKYRRDQPIEPGLSNQGNAQEGQEGRQAGNQPAGRSTGVTVSVGDIGTTIAMRLAVAVLDAGVPGGETGTVLERPAQTDRSKAAAARKRKTKNFRSGIQVLQVVGVSGDQVPLDLSVEGRLLVWVSLSALKYI
jgi:hypothetical protein